MVDGVNRFAEFIRHSIVCAASHVGFILFVEEGSTAQIGGIGIEFIDRGAIETIVGLREVTFEFGVIDWPSGIEGSNIILRGGLVATALIIDQREDFFGIVGRWIRQQFAEGFRAFNEGIGACFTIDEMGGIFHTLFVSGFGIYAGFSIELRHATLPRIEMGKQSGGTSLGSILLGSDTCPCGVAHLGEDGEHIIGLLGMANTSIYDLLLRG